MYSYAQKNKDPSMAKIYIDYMQVNSKKKKKEETSLSIMIDLSVYKKILLMHQIWLI